MDKIWDRKILRSRRSLAVVAGMKNQMTMQNRQMSKAKKKIYFLFFIVTNSLTPTCIEVRKETYDTTIDIDVSRKKDLVYDVSNYTQSTPTS